MITRRRFIGGLAAAGLGGARARAASAEPPPETTRIRLVSPGAICLAPQFAAEELLRAEGFTVVEYLKRPGVAGGEQALASGEADINMNYALRLAMRLDAGDPITVLGGVHTGCTVLFGSARVQSIRDLKGRKIAVPDLSAGALQFSVAGIMLYQVGLDPRKDVEWVVQPAAEAMQLLAAEKVGGFIGIPPHPQELRARKIGRVLVDTGRDRPWSQYFCCMVAANREFHRKHPVATKRAVRAILKGADLCSRDPEGVARLIVDRGHAGSYEYAREAVRESDYRAWRTFDPEEAMRFYGLRLREAGLVTSNPKKLIAEGTDWRIFRELRKELKA